MQFNPMHAYKVHSEEAELKFCNERGNRSTRRSNRVAIYPGIITTQSW